MWAQKSCIICYGLTPTSHPGHRSDSEGDAHSRTSAETLTRFFKLLGRHLEDGRRRTDGEDGDGQMEPQVPPIPFLEQILERGMLTCCGECSKIVESFCQLYQQMKSIQLQINRRVEKLSEIMETAQGVPAKIEEFRACAMVLDLDEFIADEVIDFKGGLVKKCAQKLKASLPPRPSNSKCRTPPQRREGHRAPAEGSSILIPKIEFEGHSPGRPGLIKEDLDDEDSSDDDVCIIEDVDREPPVKVIKLTVIPPAPTPTPATGIRSSSTGIKTYSRAKINKRTPTTPPHTHTSSQLIQMDLIIPAGGDDIDLKDPSPAVPAKGSKVEPPLIDIEDDQSPNSRSSTPTQLDNDSNHVFATQSTGGDAVVQSRRARPRKTSLTGSHTQVNLDPLAKEDIKVFELENDPDSGDDGGSHEWNPQAGEDNDEVDQDDMGDDDHPREPTTSVSPKSTPVPEECSSIDPGTGRVTCSICFKTFKNNRNFRDHYKNVHVRVGHRCKACGKVFSQVASLIRHTRTIHKQIKFECHKCHRSFDWSSQLVEHLKRPSCESTQTSTCKCHICGRELSYNYMYKHMKRCHFIGP